MRRSHPTLCALVMLMMVMISACGSYGPQEDTFTDTPERGTINVSADESFRPVVDALVQVYESNNPGTHIRVTYKPEAECLQDMLDDSTRMIIATRYYSPAEKKLVTDSLQVVMKFMIVARDAIAMIVHPDRTDSMFTRQDIRDILQGKFKENLIP